MGTADAIAAKVSIPTAVTDITRDLQAALGLSVEQMLAILLGALEVLMGLLIAFNVLTRTASVVLLLFTVFTLFFFYDFWNDPVVNLQSNKLVHAMQSLSIIGGLLILAALPRRVWIVESDQDSLEDRPVVVHESEVRP
jgi:uncharacterized membrane protein YphA (DoxX/SURF4 family)